MSVVKSHSLNPAEPTFAPKGGLFYIFLKEVHQQLKLLPILLKKKIKMCTLRSRFWHFFFKMGKAQATSDCTNTVSKRYI